MRKRILVLLITVTALMASPLARAQMMIEKTDANVFGHVTSKNKHVPFANIFVKGTNRGISTDETGHYMLIDLPIGRQTLVAKFIGYKDQEVTVDLVAGKTIQVDLI